MGMIARLSRYSWHAILTTGIATLLLQVAYLAFCQPAGLLVECEDNEVVRVAGRVVATAASEHTPHRGAYQLEEPTGRVWIISERGLPDKGSLVLVRARKTTTGEGRPLGIELRRLGTF